MAWNPDIYNTFKEQRYQPFYDLLSLVKVRPDLKVIDLGCGTGELTRKLSDQLPGAEVLGIDASAEMLRDAGTFSRKNLSFEQSEIEAHLQSGATYDLIFSNAALQWIDGHQQLFPEIIASLKEGGQLAVQVPSNHEHFTHRTLRSIAAEEPFKTAFDGWLRGLSVLSIENYSRILFDNGAREITVYEKIYPHILKDAMAIYDWTSGTAMIPYVERLEGGLKEDFIKEYQKRLLKEYPRQPVFYPFKRILMSGIF
ncbi:trans-aconitate methyltransferase [Pedobacter sp. KBW06]|uniref:methyltransferase domain-containing protein n=1 Tax=Pedobacter sp. KBW06 TaxID=2153359 RepID=UPI000F5A04A4|nr:methyltransferase domain-containing protein [Pedobacter sp. KBW06]RQO74319.1 trans-aconitate methyltransferase [Pedobacter sp. KBW06]